MIFSYLKKIPSYSNVRILGLLLLFFYMLPYQASAQPANDGWANAQNITTGAGSFGLGVFSGVPTAIDLATLEAGEFTANPIFQRSVWYTFSIATTRLVSISMQLSGTDVGSTSLGFYVYKQTTSLPVPSDLGFFTDGAVGTTSTNQCLTAGIYYIQICGALPLSVNVVPQIEIDLTTGAVLADNADSPVNAGVVSIQNGVSLEWPCLSLESDLEYFPALGPDYLEYSKSYWVTFQTDDFIDLFSYSVEPFAGASFNDSVAVRIFESPVNMSAFNPTSAIYEEARRFHSPGEFTHVPCLLMPNTTYVMQLIGRRDYSNVSMVYFRHLGEGPTQEVFPSEVGWNTANDFGVVTSTPMPGTVVSRSDFFSCESVLSQSPGACSNLNPPGGYTVTNGLTYDLVNWFTLELAQESNIIIASSTIGQACNFNIGNHQMFLRIFTQVPNNDCSSFSVPNDIIYQSLFNASGQCYITCLPPGEYSLQVLGRSALNGNPYDCSNSQFGRRHDLMITAIQPADFEYGMSIANDVDSINGGAPLELNTVYPADLAELTCFQTLLPDTIVCRADLDRAVYRTLEIGDADLDAIPDSGLLIVRNYNYLNPALEIHSNAVLYQGDINDLAISQSVFNWPSVVSGLIPQMGCEVYNNIYGPCGGGDLYNMQRYCVTPGTYTFAQLGDSSDVGAILQPTFEFRENETRFDDPNFPDNMGDLLLSGLLHVSEPDTFSCRDNPEVIDGIEPCGRTKLIYREFYLSRASQIRITETINPHDVGGVPFLLFSGQVSQDGIDGLSIVMEPEEYCSSLFQRWDCDSLPEGWYTIVSYGRGPNYDNNYEFHEASPYGFQTGCGSQAEGLYSINYPSRITIELDTTSAPGPFYHRPHLACEADEVIAYVNTQSVNYPSPFTEYQLCTEHFNDSTYQSVVGQEMLVCANNPALNKVAYYIFTTNNEYFLRIRNLGAYRKLLYNLDVTTSDSLLLDSAEPIAPCSVGFNDIEICSLPAGTYSLLVFADTSQSCIEATPIIDVSPIQYSRFDFASNAYDFATIPNDGVFYAGRVGDVHPTNPALSPSNDFFYCTTGAFATDPEVGCNGVYSDDIYNNEIQPVYFTDEPLSEIEQLRRNLWYTFVVTGNGSVDIEVRNLSGDSYGYTFHVYSTDLPGNVPWNEALNAIPSQVDSAITSGLSLVAHNIYWGCDGRVASINFPISGDPCDSLTMRRFYIVVDRFHHRDYNFERFDALNGQIDVRIRWNQAPVAYAAGDECEDAVSAEASSIGLFSTCANVACHTMQDPFWDTEQNLDCLEGPGGRSSTWFKFNYNGPDVVDVGFSPDISALQNYGLPADIDYRIFYGNTCANMLAGTECAQSAYISNTIACVDSTTGDFYVEVSYPENASGLLCFNFTVALNTNPNCVPFNPTAVDAFFVFSQACDLDTVAFTGYATVGPQMSYLWDFGHDGETSTSYSPNHSFPEGGDYLVSLTATNNLAETQAVYSQIIHVLDEEDYVNLAQDTTICFGDTIVVGRALFNATYNWSTGENTAQVLIWEPGVYTLNYTMNGCPYADSLAVSVFQVVPTLPDSIVVCANTTFEIDAAPLDSVLWPLNDAIVESLGQSVYGISPITDVTLPWQAFDEGCATSGQLDVRVLLAYIPEVPSWDSVFCANTMDNPLPVFDNLTSGVFQFDEEVITEIDGLGIAPGGHEMAYIYADFNSCPDTVLVQFTVLDTVDMAWLVPPFSSCADGDTVDLYQSVSDTSGVFYITYTTGDLAQIVSDVFVPSLATGNPLQVNSYHVLYEVASNQECVSRLSRDIVIQANPLLDIVVPTQCTGSSFAIVNLSTVDGGTIDQHFWSINDSIQTTADLPPMVQLSDIGYIHYQYVAESNFGCISEVADSVFVHPSPRLQLTYDGYCQNSLINFIDGATIELGSISSVNWTVNGIPWNGSDLNYVFSDTGQFVVSALATSDVGCTDESEIVIRIYPEPQLELTAPAACLDSSIWVNCTLSIPFDSQNQLYWYLNGELEAYNADSLLLPINNLDAITVAVEQISFYGCRSQDTLLVSVYPLPELLENVVPIEACIGFPVSFGCLPSVEPPQTIANVEWILSDGSVLNGPNQQLLIPQVGVLDATIHLVTDAGCASTVEVNNLITIHPSPEADFVLNQEVFTHYDNLLKVTDNSSENVIEWEYQISDGFNIDIPNFIHQLSASGGYDVSLLVIDVHGCKDSVLKEVVLESGVLVYIPNAITPDSDGVNDVFLPSIFGDELTSYHLLIFDRWGTVIFESFDRNEVWQGDVRNDGYYAVPDAYNYLLKITTISKEERKFQGHVVLVR